MEAKVQKDPAEGSGDWTLITKYVRDNRGLVTSKTKYHTSVLSGNRTGLSEMDYCKLPRPGLISKTEIRAGFRVGLALAEQPRE